MQLSTSKRISLWLIPPEPLVTSLASIQADIIASHPNGGRHLPRFLPHVTLVGGVPISDCCSVEEVATYEQQTSKEKDNDIDIDDYAAQIVLRRLQRRFEQYGGIELNFIRERGVFAVRTAPKPIDTDGKLGEDEGEVQWNQSCISILERNSSLMNAMQVADDVLFSTTNNSEGGQQQSIERHIKPHAYEPHYSFVYGNDAHLIPKSLQCPPSFVSTEMVIMWTYPATLDGVEQWREIGRFGMV